MKYIYAMHWQIDQHPWQKYHSHSTLWKYKPLNVSIYIVENIINANNIANTKIELMFPDDGLIAKYWDKIQGYSFEPIRQITHLFSR